MTIRCRSLILPVLSAILFISAGTVSAKSVVRNIIPNPGQTFTFSRTYSSDFLKSRPLQFLKKSTFTLSNKKGVISAKWKATIRDVITDKPVVTEAKATCNPVGKMKKQTLDCKFGVDENKVRLTSRPEGMHLFIPIGQGVHLDSKGHIDLPAGEWLLGDNDSNNEYLFTERR